MTKDNQDDEYDAIFEDGPEKHLDAVPSIAPSRQVKSTSTETDDVVDIDVILPEPAEMQRESFSDADYKLNESATPFGDNFKDEDASIIDTDIEDGIFAPERKKKSGRSKTSSLMLAASILAFVGVGGFIYVQKPDVIQQLIGNFVANDSQIADVGGIDQIDPPIDNTQGFIDASVPPTENETDQTTTPIDAFAIPPATEIADTADAKNIESDEMPFVDTSISPPDVPEASIDDVGAVPAPVSADVILPDLAAVQPAIDMAENTEVAIQHNMTTTEVDVSDGVPPIDTGEKEEITESQRISNIAVDSAPAVSEFSTEEAKEKKEIAVVSGVEPMPEETKAVPENKKIIDVPTPDPVVNAAESNVPVLPAEPQAELVSSTVPSPEKTVVKISQEEEKHIKDAKLDDYFDSPEGKMLKNIPAPSMDPKKGSRESIIIVNKAGQLSGKKPYAEGDVRIASLDLDSQKITAGRALKLGRFEAAKAMYDELYKLNPRDPEILSGRALLLQRIGLSSQAIIAYEELLKVQPDHPEGVINLSGLIRKQYPAVALNKLLDLHQKQPNNALVTAQLGVAHADSGNYEDAVRYLSEAALMEPKNPQHPYNLAIVAEKNKDLPSAIRHYEKALEVDSIYSAGKPTIPKEKIYDRLAYIRGN